MNEILLVFLGQKKTLTPAIFLRRLNAVWIIALIWLVKVRSESIGMSTF